MRQCGGPAMHQIFRLTIAAVVVAFATFPTSVPAQIAATQIKLTEKHVEGFIAAQKEMSALFEKIQSAAFSGQVNTKYQAELEAVTKKNGFKNFAEYEAVAANISMVMAAMDPQTGVDARNMSKRGGQISGPRASQSPPIARACAKASDGRHSAPAGVCLVPLRTGDNGACGKGRLFVGRDTPTPNATCLSLLHVMTITQSAIWLTCCEPLASCGNIRFGDPHREGTLYAGNAHE
jgi:hypothetical protein